MCHVTQAFTFYQVFDAILKRKTMANLAKDMDSWIEKRDHLSQKIEELKKQKLSILESEVRTYPCMHIYFIYHGILVPQC